MNTNPESPLFYLLAALSILGVALYVFLAIQLGLALANLVS